MVWAAAGRRGPGGSAVMPGLYAERPERARQRRQRAGLLLRRRRRRLLLLRRRALRLRRLLLRGRRRPGLLAGRRLRHALERRVLGRLARVAAAVAGELEVRRALVAE